MSLAMVSSPEALLEALQRKSERLSLRLGRLSDSAVVGELEDAVAHHWLVPGGVVEFAALPGAGAWSLAFVLAAIARKRARALNTPTWLAAVDPWCTLSAMALASLPEATPKSGHRATPQKRP